MLARLLTENWVPSGCAIVWLLAGFVERFPPPLPHDAHVPLPSRQVPEFATPVPSSFAGTKPEIKSDFDASPKSTYCFVAAWFAAAGFPGSVIGPVIVPPAVGRYTPATTFDTALSTYPLFVTCPVLVGAGTLGGDVKVFDPLIVSVPARCTTALSFALVANDEFTYCSETACPATPAPGVARTAARFAGEVAGTTQYSVLTCPGPIW